MQSAIKEGSYRIKIVNYSLREAKSGAVGITLHAVITHEPGPDGEWEECDPGEVEGTVWVIKKDGDANDRAVESLMNHAGWDGNLQSVSMRTWQPTPCSCTTKREEYQGTVSYKIAFINGFDNSPPMSTTRAAELQAKYGEKLRRLGGAATPKEGVPLAPPPPTDADIPF